MDDNMKPQDAEKKNSGLFLEPSPQERLMDELQRAQSWMQHPPEGTSWQDKERQRYIVEQLIQAYENVERLHAEAGYANVPRLDRESIEALTKREADMAARAEQQRETVFSTRFNMAAANMAVVCHNSVADIKAAFADKRDELVSLSADFNYACSEADGSRQEAALYFMFIITAPLGIAALRSAKEHRKEAEKIAATVDTEVNRWKLAQPKM